MERLKRKLEVEVDGFTFHDAHMRPGAETLLVTYGVTSRAARQACRELEDLGNPVSHLVLKTLWPVPEKLIRETAAEFRRVVMIEANLGQYVHEVQRVLRDKRVEFYGKMDGHLISPDRIKEIVHG